MKKKLLAVVLFFGLVGVVWGGNIFAEDAPMPSVQDQLNQIIASQSVIHQRLSAIENTLQALQKPQPMPNMPPAEDMDKEYKIDAGNSPVLGDKTAKVTIVEFSDFQCPYSQRFHPVINDVMKAYPKDVNYLLKNYPLEFHPNAKPAVKAALAAGAQGKYWEMVEALFQNGKDLGEEKYKELAKAIGINVDKFMKDLKEKDGEWEKLIAEDMTVAGNIDVRGTPTFYINGKKTSARDLNAYKAQIDKILGSQK